MSKRTKLLLCTDSTALPTGLAETCRGIFETLLERYPKDYIISQLGWFHQHTVYEPKWSITPTKFFQVNPNEPAKPEDKYGKLTFPEVVEQFKPDIVWAPADFWCFEHVLTSPYRNRFKLVVYYTVDGQPYFGNVDQEGNTDWGTKLARADRIMTMTPFGVKVLKKLPELVDREVTHLYHPSWPDRFRKPTAAEKLEAQKTYIPKHWHGQPVIGFVGHNQFRKQNHKLFEVMHYVTHGDWIYCKDCDRITIKEWAHYARESMPISELTHYEAGYNYEHCWYCRSKNIEQGKPRDALMLLHTGKGAPSWNLDLLSYIWDLEGKWTYTTPKDINTSVRVDEIPRIYWAMDLMFYPSGGEGFGNPCHPLGTLINTPAGPKSIEHITDKDCVISHTGSIQRVTGTTKRAYDGELLSITPMFNKAFEATPNHPILVAQRGKANYKKLRVQQDRINPAWLRASQLKPGDFLVSPKIKVQARSLTLTISDYVDGLEHCKESIYFPMSFKSRTGASYKTIANKLGTSVTSVYRVVNNLYNKHLQDSMVALIKDELAVTNYKKPQHAMILNNQLLDADIMEFFGYYMADGSVVSSDNAVDIAGHVRDTNRLELCKRIANRFNCKWCYKDNGLGRSITLSSKILAKLVKKLFGAEASVKKAPYWLLNSDKLCFLMSGYIAGDGSYKNGMIRIYTTSNELAEFTRLALNVLEIYAGVKKQTKLQTKANYLCYTVTIPKQFYNKARSVLSNLQLPEISNSSRKNTELIFETDKYFLVPIRDIKLVKYQGSVHNLHVENDESYLVAGHASHNCFEGLQCELPVVYSNYSSHADFCQYGGLPVRIEAYQPEIHFAINRAMVDTGDAVRQIIKLLDSSDLRASLGSAGRKHAISFDTGYIADQWHQIFQGMSKINNNDYYLCEV